MIIMPERLQELMDELKISNAETFYHSLHVKSYVMAMMKHMNMHMIMLNRMAISKMQLLLLMV